MSRRPHYAEELSILRHQNDALESRLRAAHDALETFRMLHESETQELIKDCEALRTLGLSLKEHRMAIHALEMVL
jgi:hypothetical protein